MEAVSHPSELRIGDISPSHVLRVARAAQDTRGLLTFVDFDNEFFLQCPQLSVASLSIASEQNIRQRFLGASLSLRTLGPQNCMLCPPPVFPSSLLPVFSSLHSLLCLFLTRDLTQTPRQELLLGSRTQVIPASLAMSDHHDLSLLHTNAPFSQHKFLTISKSLPSS